MEMYTSVLFLLACSFLVIVSSKSVLNLVDKSGKDIVAGIALKARLKIKNLRNDVHVSFETLVDAEDLHRIVNVVLNSPYCTNGQDNAEDVQNEASRRYEADIEKTTSAKEAIFESLVDGVKKLKGLGSDIKNFLTPDRSGEKSSGKDTEDETRSGIDNYSPTAPKKFDTLFEGLIGLFRELLDVGLTLELDTDQGRKTAPRHSGKVNLLHEILRTVEESLELAEEHPGLKERILQHFDRFDYTDSDSDRRRFQEMKDPKIDEENERLSKLSASMKNLRREIRVYKLQTRAGRLHDEIDDPVPNMSSKNASEHRLDTVDQYNDTCVSGPINEEHLSVKSKNADQGEMLTRNLSNNSLPESKRISDEEPTGSLKNRTVELSDETPALEGTNLLLPTRPSPEQHMREDKAKRLNGLRGSMIRMNESNGIDFIGDIDTADEVIGGHVFERKLKLVKKNPMEKKQPEGFDMARKGNDSDPWHEAEEWSVVTDEDENRSNADGRFEKERETWLVETEQKRDDQSSEKMLSDERRAGISMKELIGAVSVVIPHPEKHPASKMKLKSRRLLTRSIAAKGKLGEPFH